ncbi:MAG: hypothetical protein L7S56_01660 [Candidatus Poseidonia sp.]|nr:hypothetical protein [Poseidonia sp.]
MEPETTRNIVSLIGVLTLALMVWFITRRAMKNRESMMEQNAPKVAGEDELGGAARNPEQFNEPDEDALDEMAKLLGEDDEESDLEA